jgi:DNA-binding XRE family transcriptional regulator
MATQAVTLLRRDIERLLQAAGDVRAIEQLAAGDDHAAVIVVVLARPEQEPGSTADILAPAADIERVVGDPTAPTRRSALARRRREVCKTQEGLAMEVGVQRSTVARWESGDTTPSLWARPRIANALGVTLDVLDELLGTDRSDRGQAPVRDGNDFEMVMPPETSAVV